MRRLLAVTLCLFPALAQPTAVKLPKEWKGKAPRELLDRTDFSSMPFSVRDLVMLQVDPDYRKLSEAAAIGVLFEKEKESAKRDHRVAVDTIIEWTEKNPDCW